MTITRSASDSSPTIDVRRSTRTARMASSVQELLHAVALADPDTDDVVYLPESFLSNW